MSASRGKRASVNWELGTVRWFDDLKGEGVIRDSNGQSFYVHYSAIETENKRKSLKKGKEVKFKLLEDSHFTQIDKVKEVEK
jgi:cold shock CspA family protein